MQLESTEHFILEIVCYFKISKFIKIVICTRFSGWWKTNFYKHFLDFPFSYCLYLFVIPNSSLFIYLQHLFVQRFEISCRKIDRILKRINFSSVVILIFCFTKFIKNCFGFQLNFLLLVQTDTSGTLSWSETLIPNLNQIILLRR